LPLSSLGKIQFGRQVTTRKIYEDTGGVKKLEACYENLCRPFAPYFRKKEYDKIVKNHYSMASYLFMGSYF
jgi:hypothetical protein